MAKFKMQTIATELTFHTFSGIGKIHRRSSKLRVPFSCWLAAAQVYCMYMQSGKEASYNIRVKLSHSAILRMSCMNY